MHILVAEYLIRKLINILLYEAGHGVLRRKPLIDPDAAND